MRTHRIWGITGRCAFVSRGRDEAERYRDPVTDDATTEGAGDQDGLWVVSVTTNMSMDKSDLDDATDVVENDDGTTTYTKKVPLPSPPDT